MPIHDNKTDEHSHNHLDVVSILQSMPLFNDLQRRELREFARIIYLRWYKKGETIFSEQEPGIAMYIIYKGSVRLSKSSAFNGRELMTTIHGGDFFGESALSTEENRTMTAVALEECCLLGIFQPDLMRLLERKPRLGNKILLKLNQLINNHLRQRDDELFLIKEKLSNSNFIL